MAKRDLCTKTGAVRSLRLDGALWGEGGLSVKRNSCENGGAASPQLTAPGAGFAHDADQMREWGYLPGVSVNRVLPYTLSKFCGCIGRLKYCPLSHGSTLSR